ncbi:NUDIX domain-containing protein [Candidatus Woesearchaeota archaeon]|nr:NUDIX domain-containing protein [Candidatus Woesearchaeota archaeon]
MKTHLVVAGYIFHEDKVLLIHHSKLDLWLPVGGHVQRNETPDEALLREIKEEVGIDAEILNRIGTPTNGNVKRNLALPFHANVHSVGDHDHCCFFYLCKALNPKDLKMNDEIKDFRWFEEADLNKSCVPEDVRDIGLRAFEIANSKI